MAGLLLGNIFPCALCDRVPVPILPSRVAQPGRGQPGGHRRVFLLFCLVIIYLGPLLREAVDKSPNKLVWLVGGGFLCIGGIIALLLLDGLAAAFRLRGAARPVQCHRRPARREPMRSKSGFPAGRIRQDGGDLQYHRTARPKCSAR